MHHSVPLARCRAVAALLLAGAAAAPAALAQPLSGKLAFVALQPCRLVDTRVGSPLAPGEARSFNVVGATGFAAQGGTGSGCGIPGYAGGRPQVQAVALNVVAVSPQGPGHLVAWPPDQPEPLASIINYANVPGGLNVANGVLLPLAQDGSQGADVRLRAAVSGVHVVVDAVGYFTNSRRKFYLTRTNHTGASADTACAAGFHLASPFDILDPTVLDYDSSLGDTSDPRGGPPTGSSGWAHSSTQPSTLNLAGIASCDNWSSSSSSHYGSVVQLQASWTAPATVISPWHGGTWNCASIAPAWCVED